MGEGFVFFVEVVVVVFVFELVIVEFDYYEGDLFDVIECSWVYFDEKVVG